MPQDLSVMSYDDLILSDKIHFNECFNWFMLTKLPFTLCNKPQFWSRTSFRFGVKIKKKSIWKIYQKRINCCQWLASEMKMTKLWFKKMFILINCNCVSVVSTPSTFFRLALRCAMKAAASAMWRNLLRGSEIENITSVYRFIQ